MSSHGSEHQRRSNDLDAARPSGRRPKPTTLSPDEAKALIDGVFRQYGLDPVEVTDPYGWRHLQLGSAEGIAGIVEWRPGEHYLAVLAPIMNLPDESEQLADFYRLLLELNHAGTLSAHFSIHDNGVYMGLTRPIRGLDEVEVDDAIHAVMMVADGYDDWLHRTLAQILNQVLPLPELPNIKMTPKEAQAIGNVLAGCDDHGQTICRYLMERWQKLGHMVDPTATGIGFKIQTGPKSYSLASLRPGLQERSQMLVLGWEGLRRQKAFPSKAVDQFQASVLRVSSLKITESTAHLEITDTFSMEHAQALVRAMDTLAKAARPELDIIESFEWDSNLPQMDVKLGTKTLACIQETLQACSPQEQPIYAKLIEGWNQAGGTVQCSKPGRIYLKFKSREHDFSEFGKQSHTFNLAVLAAPKAKRGAAIDVSWDLSTGEYAYLDYAHEAVAEFEKTVSSLPGFEQEGTTTRLLLDEAFQLEHAQTLLKAMLALQSAAGAA